MRALRWIDRKKLALNALILPCAICFSACQEKAVEPATPGSAEGSDDDNGDDDDTGGDDDTGDFDLCEDGLKKASVDSDFDDLISEFCSSKLTTLRKSKYVYKGGSETTVQRTTDDDDAESTEMRIYSSALIDTTPKDYYNLMRLQLSDPDEIKGSDDDCEEADPFVCDPNVTLSDIDVNGDTIDYSYKNDSGEGGVVAYRASAKFIELKANVAYMVATLADEDYDDMETITRFVGMVVINKKGDETEVFTISDQAYEHTEEEKDALRSRLIEALDEEQKRSFENGENADEATELL